MMTSSKTERCTLYVIQTTYFKTMKTTCRLPNWIDDYIYRGVGAHNSPDFYKAQYNLDADNDDAINYLGTYFPRSFIESYCIFENLFSIANYRGFISHKTDVNILSFGSGSGGDIIGLLQALSAFENIRDINVLALDGNWFHLQLLKQTIKLNVLSQRFNIKFEDIPFSIQSLSDLSNFCYQIPNRFDFITSFKLVNELFSRNILGNNCYELIAENLMPKLIDTGLFLLLDVNIPLKGTYISNMMRDNLSHFMKMHRDYRTLSPIPCHFMDINCNDAKCWPKLRFTAKTSMGTNSEGITYRIMGKTPFVDYICPTMKHKNYFVQEERCCTMLRHNETPLLGFDLNN